jgi:hypothetical protein
VKVFNYSLMSLIGAKARAISNGATPKFCPDLSGPALTAAFTPFGTEYWNGVSLATGWLNGSIGSPGRIIVGQLTGPGAVKIYSSGSLLPRGPRHLSAEHGAQPHRHIHRDGELHPVRWRIRRSRRRDQHHLRWRPHLVSGVSGQDRLRK